MTDFERALVKAFNSHFTDAPVNGIAYRRKQHRFSSQFVDVLVDSKHPTYYLAIEAKSIKLDSSETLYFSQHFSTSNNGHQVDRISDFVEKSGRKGYLAVELRRGRGRPRKAYLLPWDYVDRKYVTGAPGLYLEDIQKHPEIQRHGKNYKLPDSIRETELV